MEQEQQLTEIERTLWANDPKIYCKTFLADAVIIFPEVGRIDLEFAVKALGEENAAGHRWAQVAFANVRVLSVSPNIALLHYEASARWNYKGDFENVICSTLYVKRDGTWRVAFHQQTAA